MSGHADVIVAGAGPAGALAATVLARAGARVRIFDRASFPRDKLCGDTLNPGAMRVLAPHVDLAAISARSLPIDGMLLTGGDGTQIDGRYRRGLQGRALRRRDLDALLIEHALAAGAELEDRVAVTGVVTSRGEVTGVTLRAATGVVWQERATVVVAADGRQSRLARATALLRQPQRPRRWAIGGYFDGVRGLGARGEMHVRPSHYIGVSPLPQGIANACLVVPHQRGAPGWRNPTDRLWSAIRKDAQLAPRFVAARLREPPHVLGPIAVDASDAGVPGLLLAGDAAGFIDPITGDGLRFAYAGALLAAEVASAVLAGTVGSADAPVRLRAARARAFRAKWRFNRALRLLVSSSAGITTASLIARLLPSAFESVIRYAGDADTANDHSSLSALCPAADP